MNNNFKLIETDNDWANDIRDNPIHISHAKSGAKGYYCMGCTKEMQAVKMKNPKHQSYFRHHVKDVGTTKVECVHASRIYREKLAYFYFMRVKEIKVPAVYKYPPRGQEGNVLLLQDSKTIKAHSVAREITFYENEKGEIMWGKNPKVEERYLLIRPDAVFFNEENKPILFLEFVVTHKIDIEKLTKLKRLGIDTVQIIVPKLPEPELEKSISSITKVKWAYNEIESNTEYLPSATGYPAGVPFIDEEQRKLFEENFNCRAIQIGNLVRTITRCLGSEQYRRTAQLFEQELSRVENATREHRARLDEIQARIENEAGSEFRDRILGIKQRREKFEAESSNLETRYIKKRDEITREQKNLDDEIHLRYGIGETESSIRNRFRAIEERLGNEFERARSATGRDINRESTIIRDYRRHEERIQGEIDEYKAFERDFGKLKDELKQQFERLEDEEQQKFEIKRRELQSKINDFEKAKDRLGEEFRDRFEREHQQIAERIDDKDVRGGDELSTRIEKILQVRGHLDSYKRDIERLEEAKRIIHDGTFKKWN